MNIHRVCAMGCQEIVLFLFAILPFSVLLGNAAGGGGGGDGSKTYIVGVDRHAKPVAFVTHEDWYRATVAAVKGMTMQELEGEGDVLLHVYKKVFHGFSVRLTEGQASELESLAAVLVMFPDTRRQLHTTRSPLFLGLRPAHGSLWAESDYGSDVVIGILDTGIWPERPSFSDRNLGPVPKQWRGECETGPGFNRSLCNRKLVGARFFHKGYEAASNGSMKSLSPRDMDGHGTHTASTAAGSYAYGASMFGYAPGVAKGVAPKGRVAVYKVCWPFGCFSSDILAAFDWAVADGVDVISLSVGGGVVPYYLDSIALGAFGAMQHGVFVSAAGGNEGPGSLTVTNVAPWIATVGAGTLDRDFPADVLLGNGQVIPGVSLYSGRGLDARHPLPLLYAGDASIMREGSDSYSASLCLEGALDPKVVKGKIVLCERGNGPRVAKGAEVKNAGGLAMILTNRASDGEGLVADAHVLPASGVGASSGDAIRRYILSTKNATAIISFHGTRLDIKPAPMVASFSARGPNPETPEILKPDMIAPGANILAAWTGATGPSDFALDRRQTEFNIMSGTSMACPHVSGLAALLKVAHPDWSPPAIKSALMTTAYIWDNKAQILLDEATRNASNPFDFGAGHVDAKRAMEPGLVYDLTTEDYVNFLCSLNYSEKALKAITRKALLICPAERIEPGNLNYPSFAAVFDQAGSSKLSAVFVRTVTNVGLPVSSYDVKVVEPPNGVEVTVKPTMLNFTRKNMKLSYTVTVSATPLKLLPGNSNTVFGWLSWTDRKHIVQSPIAVTRTEPYEAF